MPMSLALPLYQGSLPLANVSLPPWKEVKNKLDGASPSAYADFGRDKYALAGVGPNLVVNGDFSSGATGWTTDAGVTISGGAAVFTSVAAGVGMYCTLSGISVGDIFSVTYTVSSWTSGQVRASLETSRGATRTTVGSFNELIIATQANPRLFIQGVAGSNAFSVTGIIVRKLTSSLGPELVQNGTFSTSLAGWDTSASTAPSTFVWSSANGGQAITSTDGTSTARIRQTITTIPGRTYVANVSGGVNLGVGTTAGASDLLNINTTSRVFTAVGASTYLSGFAPTNGLTFDNVSVREVLVGFGPELVANSGFDTDLSGWTDNSAVGASMSWVNGRAVASTDGVAIARLRTSFPTVVGRTYRVACAGTGGVAVGTTAGQAEYTSVVGGEKTFVATTTTAYLSYSNVNNGLYLDFVSAREVLTNQPVRSVTFPEMFLLSSGAKTIVANDNTLKTVPANTSAFDYSTGQRRLLLEGAATNLCSYNNAIATGWYNNGTSNTCVDSGATIGDYKWFEVSEGAGAGNHMWVSQNASFTSGNAYTFSCYVKYNDCRYVQLTGTSGGFGGAHATFDLVAGTVLYSNGFSASVLNLGGGVYLLTFVAVASSTGTAIGFIFGMANDASPASTRLPSYTGTNRKVWVAAPQTEVGTAPSSRILTAASSVTRVTDLCSFSPLLNLCITQQAVTMAYRANTKTLVAGQQFIGLSSGNALLRSGAGTPAQVVFDGHSTTAVGLATVLPGEQGTAIGWDTSGRAGTVNGNTIVANANAPDRQMPPFFFGPYNGMSAGTIHALGAFVAWPTKGTNSNIQAQARVYA